MSNTIIRRDSPSKINLFLKITGKLPNGYHEIDTVFLPLDNPGDEIVFSFDDSVGITISSSSSVVPCDERNLCWKAAELYSCAAGVGISGTIHIEKRIPVAAGMGGGSSNAAVVLSILNEVYKACSDSELAELALKLGADVPFFLNPCLSTATGVGEKLVPVDFEYGKLPLVIVAPHFPVSAAWAYRHCCVADDFDCYGQVEDVLDAIRQGDVVRLSKLVRNDLAIPLFNKFPILTNIRNSLMDAGALCAEVSGSGPTMFALCENDLEAERICGELRCCLPDGFDLWVAG